MEKKTFKYFAFISYSHSDKKIAKKLKKWLKNYHLPSRMVENHPNLPKDLNPIFMDETNLVAKGNKSLRNSLQENLNISNYLIVICSPNSAKSKYVNDEVDYFIKIGRSDHIVPFIIDGIPYSKDPDLECFPPALLALTEGNELLGINFKQHGKTNSFLRIIATMLELDLDEIIRERNKKLIILSLIAAVFMSFLVIFIWHNIPHYSYYRAYVYRWEKPIGLFKVTSESERKKMEYTYRFTTLRGEVKKIERINSAGILVDPVTTTPFIELPMICFVADGIVDYYDLYQRKIYRKKYSNLEAVDFYCSDGIIHYALPADMYNNYNFNQYSPENSINQNKANIIRLILEHDSNGFVIKKTFRADTKGGTDKKGTPAPDQKGRWGLSYKLDDMGRIIEVHNLNQNGEPMGVNGIYAEYIEYDNTPYITKISRVDKNSKLVIDSRGVAFDKLVYNEYFNPEKISCYGINGERVFDKNTNISEIVYTYDLNNGFVNSINCYDTNLAPCICKEGYFRIGCDLNKEGRVIKYSYYDINQKITVLSNGYAAINIKYNDDGYILSRTFTDSENKPAVNFNSNTYGSNYTYEDGFIKRIDYIDSNGNFMLNKYGYFSEILSFDREENKLISIIYKNSDDKKVMTSHGYAEERYIYKGGNLSAMTFHNESGDLFTDKFGTAKYVYDHKNGNLVSIRHFDEKNKPALNNLGYAGVDYEYNDNGLKISEKYYDTEVKRVIIPAGYSAIKYTYDNGGNKISETYYDAYEHYIIKTDEYYCYAKIFDYDDNGNIKHIQYLREENSKYQDMLDSQIEDIFFEYDNKGNEIKKYFFNGKGEETDSKGNINGAVKIEKEYDFYGRMIKYSEYKQGEEKPFIIQEYKRDSFGRIISTSAIRYSGNNKDFITRKIEYDKYGNLCKEYYLDSENKLFIPDKQIKNMGINYAIKKMQYNIWGYETDVFYYDEKGKPLHSDNRAFHTKREFYPRGYILSENYYSDENEKNPAELSDGCHTIISLCNGLGQETERWLYRANKILIRRIVKDYVMTGRNFGKIKSIEIFNPILTPSVDPQTGVFKTVYEYDSYGNQSDVRFFDADNEPCSRIYMGKAGWHHYKRSYDEMGHILSEEFFDFDIKEEPYLFNGFHKILRAYNSYGLCTEEAFYDNKLNLLNKKLIKYDSDGKKTGEEWLYSN